MPFEIILLAFTFLPDDRKRCHDLVIPGEISLFKEKSDTILYFIKIYLK